MSTGVWPRMVLVLTAVLALFAARTLPAADKLIGIHSARVLSQSLPWIATNDRKVLDAAYNGEVKVLEKNLEITDDGIQSILDEVARTDPRAKQIKAQDLIDRRLLNEMQKSGFFDRLWSKG